MHTLESLREQLESAGLYATSQGGAVVVPVTRAEDPDRPFYACFVAGANALKAYAGAKGFAVDASQVDDALAFCNRWNSVNSFPCAYLNQDDDFELVMTLAGNAEHSAAYVLENFLRLFIRVAGDFFEAAGENF